MKKKLVSFVLTLAAIVAVGTFKIDAKAAVYSDPNGSTFDAEFYAATYPDVAAVIGNNKEALCTHYITVGKAEGRFPNAAVATQAIEKANAIATGQLPAVDPLADDGIYNILAIGNSITVHPVCNYWWGTWGMAATSPEKDYIHQVALGVQQTTPQPVNLDVYRSGWEGSSNRNMMLPNMDLALANNYDLVVIQLGENVLSLSKFETDFTTFINYVRQSQPNAKIVVVGDYWYQAGRDAIKQRVAESTGNIYVDISAIRGVSKYRSSIGTKVLGDDGKYHKVYTGDVAIHPNDSGMAYIAGRVLESIQ